MKSRLFLTALFIFAIIPITFADMVYLKNGRTLEGIVTNTGDEVVQLEVSMGTVKFNKNEVDKIENSSSQQNDALRLKWAKEKQASEARMEKIKYDEERKPKAVEFAEDKQSIIVNCLLDNKVSAKLVLDTGASTVILRNNVAQPLLGINSGRFIPDMKVRLADGRMADAKFIIIGSIKVQGVEAKRVEACVLTSDVAGEDIQDGLLGMSFLKNFKFTIDQKAKKLILEKQ